MKNDITTRVQNDLNNIEMASADFKECKDVNKHDIEFIFDQWKEKEENKDLKQVQRQFEQY